VAPATATIGAGPGGEVRVELPEAGLSLEAVERALVVAALERAGGNQTRAARLLAISRDTLRYRMEEDGLRECPPGRLAKSRSCEKSPSFRVSALRVSDDPPCRTRGMGVALLGS